MPSFRTHRIVKHPPRAMYDLVSDVERYPEFLPLCERLVVRSRAPRGEAAEEVVASMTVGYGPIRESFTTRVRLFQPQHTILVSYIDGPFRRLENTWTFHPHAEGCRVEFSIIYEFRSIALGMAMGALFDRAFRKFAEAFEARADAIYGGQDAAFNRA
ncbi:MAG: type II toxin-antitoxin system RatA family toxin [Hyphomicrobiaceae bacterium]|nr:type II toxin-antitoxin system RatA family toxin [Hyphomicrobiaceae bacterium]